MYDLHSDFDIELHKKTFVNYLEVIIHPDGSIHYAVPSHQIYLAKYGAAENNCSVEEFEYSCPPDRYFDYLRWLIEVTGCISVWSSGYMADTITSRQRTSLIKLIENNLTTSTKL